MAPAGASRRVGLHDCEGGRSDRLPCAPAGRFSLWFRASYRRQHHPDALARRAATSTRLAAARFCLKARQAARTLDGRQLPFWSLISITVTDTQSFVGARHVREIGGTPGKDTGCQRALSLMIIAAWSGIRITSGESIITRRTKTSSVVRRGHVATVVMHLSGGLRAAG